MAMPSPNDGTVGHAYFDMRISAPFLSGLIVLLPRLAVAINTYLTSLYCLTFEAKYGEQEEEEAEAEMSLS